MQTSPSGMRFIACREAFVSLAYIDGEFGDGSPRYSLGFGSQDPPPVEGQRMKIEDAFPRLRENIESRAEELSRNLKGELPQHVFDALSSLYYQSGSKVVKGSTELNAQSVTELFNSGDMEGAIAEFVKFRTNARFVYKPGLLRRRFKEITLADSANYGDITKYKSFDGDPSKVSLQWMPFPVNI